MTDSTHCQPHSTIFTPSPCLHTPPRRWHIEAGFPFAAAMARAGTGWPGRACTFVLSLTPFLTQTKKKDKKICHQLQGAIGLQCCLQPSQQVAECRPWLPLSVFLGPGTSFHEELSTAPYSLVFATQTPFANTLARWAGWDKEETSSSLPLSYCRCFTLPRCRHMLRPGFTQKTWSSSNHQPSQTDATPVRTPNFTTSGSPICQLCKRTTHPSSTAPSCSWGADRQDTSH